jgi:hypothetical protein
MRIGYERALLKMRTGELFSAHSGDYFMQTPDYQFKGMALVEKVPLRRKNVVMGTGWKILKKNPRRRDLVDVI